MRKTGWFLNLTLAVILTAAAAFAVTMRAEIPASISLDDLKNPTAASTKALDDFVYGITHTGEKHDYDLVLMLTKNGKPIEFYTEPAKTKSTDGPSGQLKFGRGHEPCEWTDEQWRYIYAHLYNAWGEGEGFGAYYLGRRIFGPPFHGGDITIKCDPTLSYPGVYYDHVITLNVEYEGEFTDNDRGVLSHEMLHAFQDGYISFDQFCEGMAAEGAVCIQNIIASKGYETDYSELHHQDPYSEAYEYYAAYNQPAICPVAAEFSGGAVYNMPTVRYHTAAMAWHKPYVEDSDYFAKFNCLVYDRTGKSWRLNYDELADCAIDAYGSKPIEGCPTFAKWFEGQYPLRTTFVSSYRLLAVPLGNKVRVWTTYVDADDILNVHEDPYETNVELRFYDYNNQLRFTRNLVTDLGGYDVAYFQPSEFGLGSDYYRYRVEATATFPSGPTTTENFGVTGPTSGMNSMGMLGLLKRYAFVNPQPVYVDVRNLQSGVAIYFPVDVPYAAYYAGLPFPENTTDRVQWRITFGGGIYPEKTIIRNSDNNRFFIPFDEAVLGMLAGRKTPEPTVAAKALTCRAAYDKAEGRVVLTYENGKAAAADGGNGAPATASVFDVTGRKVASLAGNNGTVLWQLDGSNGQRVPPGVYIYKLTQGEADAAGKVAVY